MTSSMIGGRGGGCPDDEPPDELGSSENISIGSEKDEESTIIKIIDWLQLS